MSARPRPLGVALDATPTADTPTKPRKRAPARVYLGTLCPLRPTLRGALNLAAAQGATLRAEWRDGMLAIYVEAP